MNCFMSISVRQGGSGKRVTSIMQLHYNAIMQNPVPPRHPGSATLHGHGSSRSGGLHTSRYLAEMLWIANLTFAFIETSY